MNRETLNVIDITQKPYFSHNDCIDRLMEPIRNQVDLRLSEFTRRYPKQERFLICTDEFCTDYFTNQELYRYGLYEEDIEGFVSSYNMWDHLPYAPSQIYEFARNKHNQAHGLTIVKQHGEYCDFFSFSAAPNNHKINNFYLNQKDLFEAFTQDFYEKLAPTLDDLSNHRIIVPSQTKPKNHALSLISPRQLECAQLIAKGLSSKEVARTLHLSPRTVDEYIDILKKKFNVKNRPQLLYSLNKQL